MPYEYFWIGKIFPPAPGKPAPARPGPQSVSHTGHRDPLATLDPGQVPRLWDQCGTDSIGACVARDPRRRCRQWARGPVQARDTGAGIVWIRHGQAMGIRLQGITCIPDPGRLNIIST